MRKQKSPAEKRRENIILERFRNLEDLSLKGLDSLLSGTDDHHEKRQSHVENLNSASSFSDAHYLTLILSNQLPDKQFYFDCSALLTRLGGLANLFDTPGSRLTNICSELSLRLSGEFVRKRLDDIVFHEKIRQIERDKRYISLRDYGSVLKHLVKFNSTDPTPQLIIYNFDGGGTFLGTDFIKMTLNDKLTNCIRNTISVIITSGAARYVLCRNDKDGRLNPTDMDMIYLRRVRSVEEALGIEIFDFVITSGSTFYSFKNTGLMTAAQF